MSRLVVPEAASAAQRRSSDPAASVWVSANAGAGKTYVLAQRVVRLLLSGVAPGAILCLTFTNAAAAEMSNRVYGELAALATLEEETLRERVAALAPEVAADVAAGRARTLFARTLETPGGLRIATIHAFAASLLRRFPLEAEVPSAFEILDDPTREEIEARALADVLAQADADPRGALAEALVALVPHVSDGSVADAVRAMLACHDTLAAWRARFDEPTSDALRASLEVALALPEPLPRTLSDARCREIIALEREHGSGKQIASHLEAALAAPQGPDREAAWRAAFLTNKGETRTLKLGKVLKIEPGLVDELGAEADRVRAEDERRCIADAIDATVALVALTVPVMDRVDDALRRRGLIGYDAQIEKAAALVEERDAADWVRYKLDEGIDHVMVDEAQDTAPAQWALIGKLVEEFFAGRGAKESRRTLFVVGDEKQSIYSFQGAVPKRFAQMREHYGGKSADAGLAFERVELAHSFRSTAQVLSAVDRVFAGDPLARSVGAAPGTVRHLPILASPGGVDLWPLLRTDESETPPAWDAPFDVASDQSGEVKLARAIVRQIEAYMEEGPDGGPPVRPGGVFVLMRKRGRFAGIMNRELKAAGIPAAGADRLVVTEHIAVKDMLALGRALISPDDLALAAVLRSPLFDVCEDDLFALAHGRTGTLFAALREGDETARGVSATLERWRRLALTARPFDLFAHILYGEGRRADFAARMGAEAQDALDAFLELALAHEGRGVPALEPFLSRMEKVREELRRSVDDTVDAVRVMTVHGAKGLEADVVFLADIGAEMVRGRRGAIVRAVGEGDDGVVVYAPSARATPPAVQDVLDAEKARDLDEHHRLLYVAMTRARRHLVVCGAYLKRTPKDGMWHQVVREALGPDCTELGEGRLAWRRPPPDAPHPPAQTQRGRPATPAPDYLWRPVAPAALAPLPQPLAPSSHAATAPVARTAGQEEGPRITMSAAAFGTLVHGLLERDGLGEGGPALARRLAPEADEADIALALREARAALALPELAAARTVWREVPVIGDVALPSGEVRRVSGRIDRLEAHEDRLLVLDYKTDRAPPATPSSVPRAYLEQLALYRALIGACDPRQRVDVAILWTAAARTMALTEALPPGYRVRPAA